MPVNVIIIRQENGNFARCFHSLQQAFERGFLLENSHSNRKEQPIKAGYISEPNWTYHEKDKASFNIIALIFREQNLYQTSPRFIDSPDTDTLFGAFFLVLNMHNPGVNFRNTYIPCQLHVPITTRLYIRTEVLIVYSRTLLEKHRADRVLELFLESLLIQLLNC